MADATPEPKQHRRASTTEPRRRSRAESRADLHAARNASLGKGDVRSQYADAALLLPPPCVSRAAADPDPIAEILIPSMAVTADSDPMAVTADSDPMAVPAEPVRITSTANKMPKGC